MKNTKKKFMLIATIVAAPFFTSNLVDTNYVLAEDKSSQEYKLITTVSTYDTSQDAKNKTNVKSKYKAGTYYIYKESNGMLNISREKGKVGAWINPTENKKQETVTITTTQENNQVVKSNEPATLQIGWVKEGSTWYYKNSQGQNIKNQWIEGKYYLDADGKMLIDAWTPDGYYVDASGVWVPGKTKTNQVGWVKEGNAWYYKDAKGQNIKNLWAGDYYLKADGKMAVSEWIFDNYYKAHYYVDANGIYVRNTWKDGYYLKADGKRAINEWIYDNNYKSNYYIKANGIYAVNQWKDNAYLKADGKMAVSEWIYDTQRKAYYYFTSNGNYAKNSWMDIYYLKADGKMAVSEWIYDSAYQSNYYLDASGAYAKNTWIGDHYLKADGKMAVSEWTPDGYYVDNSGKWDPSKERKLRGTVFLDPGHGGVDPGAVNSRNTEKQLNMAIYSKLSEKLRNNGYTVLTSRDSDVNVGLVDRAVRADNTNADIFISIHFNAAGNSAVHGIETYWYQYAAQYPPTVNKNNHLNAERLRKSEILANRIQNNLIAQTGAKNNGVRRGAYVVVKETRLPAVLLELGYMSNPEEAARIGNSSYQDRLVDGIVAGIESYYQAI